MEDFSDTVVALRWFARTLVCYPYITSWTTFDHPRNVSQG